MVARGFFSIKDDEWLFADWSENDEGFVELRGTSEVWTITTNRLLPPDLRTACNVKTDEVIVNLRYHSLSCLCVECKKVDNYAF